jgi:hypothetical protein
MEKRINDKARAYVTEFKEAIRARVLALNFGEESSSKVNDLLELVVEYDRLCYDKDDFIKRKRVKNSIPTENRCVAKRANGEQCTRKRRADCEFCGTHYKSTPHGSVSENTEVPIEDTQEKQRQIEVVAEDIGGIVYYLDAFGNVYNTEDVIRGKDNPQIVARYSKTEGKYQIPEFGLM